MPRGNDAGGSEFPPTPQNDGEEKTFWKNGVPNAGIGGSHLPKTPSRDRRPSSTRKARRKKKKPKKEVSLPPISPESNAVHLGSPPSTVASPEEDFTPAKPMKGPIDLKRQRTVDVKLKYKIRKKLGSGAFATVRRVVDRATGKDYALKMVRKKGMDESELENLDHEIKIMKIVDHKHCIKLFDCYVTATYTYLVMDLCVGGELFDVLTKKKSFSEEETSNIIRQIALALDYLHERNIVHRDLKPENLLLTDDSPNAIIKLCDFGLAREVPEGGLNRPCGTPTYVAPEVIKSESYGCKADWWSVGVILYLLLCGFPPFWDQNPKKLFRKIKRGFIFFPAPYWDHVSLDARNLILGLLNVDASKRYSSKELLNHTWVKREASQIDMGREHRDRMRRFHIRSQMRKAVNTCLALTRLIAVLVDPTMTVEELVQQRNAHVLHVLDDQERHSVQLDMNALKAGNVFGDTPPASRRNSISSKRAPRIKIDMDTSESEEKSTLIPVSTPKGADYG